MYSLKISTLKNFSQAELDRYIQACELQYTDQLLDISRIIRERHIRYIFLAGPSCSGKTTSSLILIRLLKEIKKKVKLISLDDFFREKEHAVLDEHGIPNYDCFDHMDTEYLYQVIDGIKKEETVLLPSFDFYKGGRKSDYAACDPKEYDIFIFEGLHSLNDHIVKRFDRDGTMGIFINVDASYTVDEIPVFDPVTVRLVRRLIRDYHFRGSTPENTYLLWGNVQKSEHDYIFPFAKNADFTLATGFAYEPCVMKDSLFEVLSGIRTDSEYYYRSHVLQKLFEDLPSIDRRHVPANSLLREFIGY